MNSAPKTSNTAYANSLGQSGSLEDIIDRTRGESREKEFCTDVGNYLIEYARERPDVAALWCFGIGFVLGWRLKPW